MAFVPPTPKPPLMTLADAAARLESASKSDSPDKKTPLGGRKPITEETVKAYIQMGKLGGHRKDGELMVDRSDVERMAAAQAGEVKARDAKDRVHENWNG